MSKTLEPYYLRRAEEVIDTLFDKKYFREDVTRKEMKKVDELIAYLLQSSAESAVKVYEMNRKLSKEIKDV